MYVFKYDQNVDKGYLSVELSRYIYIQITIWLCNLHVQFSRNTLLTILADITERMTPIQCYNITKAKRAL